MTRSSGRHLTCESISAADAFSVGEEKRTCDTESLHTGNWVSLARKEGQSGSRKHLEAILVYSFPRQQRGWPSLGARGQAWTGRCLGSISGPRENSFTHSLIHSFPKVKVRSLVPGEPVAICQNNLKTGWVRAESLSSEPKQLKAWPLMELIQVLHFQKCTTWRFPNVAQPLCPPTTTVFQSSKEYYDGSVSCHPPQMQTFPKA